MNSRLCDELIYRSVRIGVYHGTTGVCASDLYLFLSFILAWPHYFILGSMHHFPIVHHWFFSGNYIVVQCRGLQVDRDSGTNKAIQGAPKRRLQLSLSLRVGLSLLGRLDYYLLLEPMRRNLMTCKSSNYLWGINASFGHTSYDSFQTISSNCCILETTTWLKLIFLWPSPPSMRSWIPLVPVNVVGPSWSLCRILQAPVPRSLHKSPEL